MKKAIHGGRFALFILALAAAGNAATVVLDWTAVAQNADGSPFAAPSSPTPAELSGYRVFYRATPLAAMTTAQAMTDGSVQRVDVGTVVTHPLDLLDGTSYYFRLTARDASSNQSGWSVQPDLTSVLEVSTFTPAPSAPTGLTAAGLAGGQVRLNWMDNSGGEAGFRIERSLDNVNFSLLTTAAAAAGTGARTFTDNAGLSAGTTYYYQVRANGGAVNSGYSNRASAVAAGGAGPAGFASLPGLKEAYCYPNPAKGVDPVIRAMMGGVDFIEVTIYDPSGAVAHSGRTSARTLVNGQPAYEYRWAGEKATGVYYAVIHGKKGEETVRARAKFAVVR